jgi:extracellular factor (EF) 3-hydroxypalmitic acid methyl ester biosynthesis protein
MAVTQDMEQRECVVRWLEADGREISAPVLRLARHLVAFEANDPSIELKTSQSLTEFRVVGRGRDLYRGRAVVSDLVTTGMGLICQIQVEEGWIRSPGGGLETAGAEFQDWLIEWQDHFHINREFKEALLDLQAFLQELRRWCEQVELQVEPGLPRAESATSVHLSELLAPLVEPQLRSLFDRFETVARHMKPEHWRLHCALGRRLLHPLLLSAPFVSRSYHKPLGHAGDFEMVNMMFRNPHQGESLLARLINYYALRLPPIIAHRNRIDYMVRVLEEEAVRLRSAQGPMRYLSIGCGPAHEVQRFARTNPLATGTDFTLVDFDSTAVRHLRKTLSSTPTASGRPLRFRVEEQSIARFIRAVLRQRGNHSEADGYDVVCCAGLFDYLPDPVCRQAIETFHAQLRPGGRLVVTNVDDHPCRYQMELFLDWHVILRNQSALEALLPSMLPRETVTFRTDYTGVNHFLEIRKPKEPLAPGPDATPEPG